MKIFLKHQVIESCVICLLFVIITYLICFLDTDTLKIVTNEGPSITERDTFQENEELAVLVKSRRYTSPNLLMANEIAPYVKAEYQVEEQKEEINTEVEEPVVEETPVETPSPEPVETSTQEQVVVEETVTYTLPEPNYDLGNQVVEFAKQFVGNPYVAGGTSLTNGADCSGFTMSVYANFGISIARTATGQINSGYQVSLDNIMPGDLVLSGYNGQICHSSMYIGNNQLVHALNENTGIVITDINIMPIIAVVRVI